MLGEYAQDPSRYFTSGSNFTLLDGEHYLNVSLVLNGVIDITIRGSDIEATLVYITTGGSISWINSQNVVLAFLRLKYEGNTAMSHSAMSFEASSVRISDVKFTGTNREAVYSQAIRMLQSTATIINCNFTGWHSTYGGAIFTLSSVITLSGYNSFVSNAAEEFGGGIYADNSMLTFTGVNTFQDNRARSYLTDNNEEGGGGGLYSIASYIRFDGFTIFERNGPIRTGTDLLGGGINVNNSTLRITGQALFSENSGKFGGCIQGYNSNISLEGQVTFSQSHMSGTVSLLSCNFSCVGKIDFTDNSVSGYGTAVYSVDSSITFNGEINFTNNTAQFGGGGALYAFRSQVYWQGDITFSNNSVGDYGGGVYIYESVLESVGNVTFRGNSAEYRGGGMYAIDSTANFSGRCSFSENRAVEGGGMGLEGNAELVLHSPIVMNFHRNLAISKGGALLYVTSTQCQNFSKATYRNCFFGLESESFSGSIVKLLNFTGNNATDAGTILYGFIHKWSRNDNSFTHHFRSTQTLLLC